MKEKKYTKERCRHSRIHENVYELILIAGIEKEESQDSSTDWNFNHIMLENFPKIEEWYTHVIQEASRTPNKTRKETPHTHDS